ncbi:8760_t:CDS:1, partial [Gigaspora rosea]
KHSEVNKQRNTSTYLEQYHCEGIIKIEVLSNLNFIKIVYSHKILYSRPRNVATTLEIKSFIKSNIDFSVPELWRQI